MNNTRLPLSTNGSHSLPKKKSAVFERHPKKSMLPEKYFHVEYSLFGSSLNSERCLECTNITEF